MALSSTSGTEKAEAVKVATPAKAGRTRVMSAAARAVAELKRDRSYIGRRATKKLDGRIYRGTVKGFLPPHRLWSIRYEDGDVDEMDWSDLSKAMELHMELHDGKGKKTGEKSGKKAPAKAAPAAAEAQPPVHCQQSTAPHCTMPSTSGRAKLVLFGDSITQASFSASDRGWGARLADRYQRRADVLNRGFAGYNTDWFLRFAATGAGQVDLLAHGDVRLVAVFFGANDASDPVLNARQHVPLDAFRSNLGDVAALARRHFGPAVRVVLISPPPVCHAKRLQFQRERYGEKATGELERTLELSGKYANCVKEVARELGLPFLDLWTTMQFTPSGESRDWEDFLSDGLHLSASGNEFLGDSLIAMIDRLLPDLSVTPCPQSGNINSSSICPAMERTGLWHDEIDHTQPDKAFQGC